MMTMMRKNNIFALALCFALSGSVAGAQSSDALSFVRIIGDPVSAGMGFAGVASASGTAYSAFRNSSLIPLSEKKADIGAGYQIWAPDGAKSDNISFGAAFRLGGRFGLSIGGVRQSGEAYSLTSDNGHASGTFSPEAMVLNGGVGVRLLEGLSLGVNFRYASQTLAEDVSYSAYAGDVFASCRLGQINLSAGVSSLGTSVKGADGTEYSLPTSATLGFDWSGTFSGRHGLKFDADADYFFSGGFSAAAGAQYSFGNMLFVRAGYHFGGDKSPLPSFASAGLGVKLAGLELNAAYLLASDILGGTLTAGIGYSF